MSDQNIVAPVSIMPASAVNGGGASVIPLYVPDGTVALPSLARSANHATGFYFSSDAVRFSANGTTAVEMGISGGVNYVQTQELFINATPAIKVNGSAVDYTSASLMISGTAPTISSGFGTSPSVVASNGTAAFTVNVGTGGAASSGVIAMPTATTGWIASVKNLTQLAANRADRATVQTASTTGTITVQSVVLSTGAAVAWTASDILQVTAVAY